jgi:hypothetical protein
LVVELADPTFPLRNSPRLIYYGSTPLDGVATVEIERDGCSLATGVTNADGSFSIDGTALGDVSVRIRPPADRPDLITTIHHFRGDPLIAYPILTRAALAAFFEAMYPGATPKPDRGHIIVNFVLAFNAAPIAGARFSAPGFGEIVYDGLNESGDLGLGAALNVIAKPYPGAASSVTIYDLDDSKHDDYVGVAQDAVSFVVAPL